MTFQGDPTTEALAACFLPKTSAPSTRRRQTPFTVRQVRIEETPTNTAILTREIFDPSACGLRLAHGLLRRHEHQRFDTVRLPASPAAVLDQRAHSLTHRLNPGQHSNWLLCQRHGRWRSVRHSGATEGRTWNPEGKTHALVTPWLLDLLREAPLNDDVRFETQRALTSRDSNAGSPMLSFLTSPCDRADPDADCPGMFMTSPGTGTEVQIDAAF